MLVGVAALGVLGAGAAGLLVARAALRPVDRLTEAVEHVASTEDLTIRIPVEGTDEIARLAASFNAMTAALAGSRDRQQQLIADAGHELRTPLTIAAHQHRPAAAQRADRPAAARRRPSAAAGHRQGADAELAALVGDLLQLSRADADQRAARRGRPARRRRAPPCDRARLRGPG